jgi:hypothetical protein
VKIHEAVATPDFDRTDSPVAVSVGGVIFLFLDSGDWAAADMAAGGAAQRVC